MKVGVGLGKLTLVCRKCTRESMIPAPTMEVAVELAKLRGWVTESDAFRETFVCPTCPSGERIAQVAKAVDVAAAAREAFLASAYDLNQRGIP